MNTGPEPSPNPSQPFAGAPNFQLRAARPADAPAVIELICALAEFEHLPPPDAAGQARLREHGFGPKPRFETWVAEVPGQSSPVGYAIFFETYSTFEARPTIYIEDIFVLPQFRQLGIGTGFLKQCLRLAHDRGCGRMEWTCLDWNRRAQCVYESLGAQPMKEWILYRMTRDKMEFALAETNSKERRRLGHASGLKNQ